MVVTGHTLLLFAPCSKQSFSGQQNSDSSDMPGLPAVGE